MVMDALQLVFRDVFENPSLCISPDTVAEDIDEWDSLSHIQIMKELEQVFNIRFSSKELLSWDNVGEMVEAISDKLSKQ